MRFGHVVSCLLVLALGVAGCSKESSESTEEKAVPYAPVLQAAVYTALVEKPDAVRVLLIGGEARALTNEFAHAGVKPCLVPKGTFDLVVVSCGEMTRESCERACGWLKEAGVFVWMMDVSGVSAAAFKARLDTFVLPEAHLWMPGASRWLLVGRRAPASVRLEAMLNVFAREKAFDDFARARCTALPDVFANYVGTRAEILPAFAAGDQSADVRAAFFLTKEIPTLAWLDTQGLDDDIVTSVRAEIRSRQVVRREVVSGDLASEAAQDKKGEEAATESWARAYLRNPNDLFLQERLDRLDRNAQGFLAVGKVLMAMKCYETMVLIAPNVPRHVHNFGMCLKKIGKADMAEQVLKRAEALQKSAEF